MYLFAANGSKSAKLIAVFTAMAVIISILPLSVFAQEVPAEPEVPAVPVAPVTLPVDAPADPVDPVVPPAGTGSENNTNEQPPVTDVIIESNTNTANESSNRQLTRDLVDNTDSEEVMNTCLIPDSLGDEAEFALQSSGEKTIGQMLTDHGYGAIDTTLDQMNYQVWNLTDTEADSVTFSLRVLGKRAGNNQIVGYYKAGDVLTFTSALTQTLDTDGEASVSVTIPAAFADSFGFALQSADKTWFSEIALNSDEEDHVAVYNPSSNVYLLGFEDFNNLGDGDYNDIVIEVTDVTCNTETDPETKTISGYKFNDENGDGEWDEGEEGIPGWEILLEGEDEEDAQSTTTDSTGYYSFVVGNGSYQVTETAQKGWEQTALIGDGADGDTCYINVSDEVLTKSERLKSSDDGYTCDFGNHQIEVPQCTETENLLANGSFETPTVDPESDGWDIFDSVVDGLAWVVTWINPATEAPEVPKLELQDGRPASDGEQYAELDSNYTKPGEPQILGDARVKIAQTVPTVVGTEYTFTFDLSAIPGRRGGPQNNKVNVLVNDVVVDVQTANGLLQTSTNWTTHSFTFTAVSTSTEVALADAGRSNTFGTFVDNATLIGCKSPNNGGDGDGNNEEETDTPNRNGGGSSSGTRVKRAPRGEVLGAATSAPAGAVLGDATSTLPVGAPNTGAGGTSPLSVQLPTIVAILPKADKSK